MFCCFFDLKVLKKLIALTIKFTAKKFQSLLVLAYSKKQSYLYPGHCKYNCYGKMEYYLHKLKPNMIIT